MFQTIFSTSTIANSATTSDAIVYVRVINDVFYGILIGLILSVIILAMKGRKNQTL